MGAARHVEGHRYRSRDRILNETEAGLENGQRYSAASAAEKRAAWLAVQKHCDDKTEKQCREIINAWLKNGVLFAQDYDDPVERKKRSGLRLNPSKRPS